MHVHADYPPPKSWEQFEELCADIFEAEWRDPATVRHGRAGQAQHGVDIVGRNGATYPIGLQCKRKTAWPVSKLTKKDIDKEVEAAREFSPALKSFFLLTTAPDDTALQSYVRQINEDPKSQNSFEVILLGWHEIVRRATRHPQVADKHFGVRGSASRSTLHATFYLAEGRLIGDGDDHRLLARELIQDFRDDPRGHVVVRQRESDELVQQIAGLVSRPLTKNSRNRRIKLRDDLYRLTRQEQRAADGLRLMLTDKDIASWLLRIWEPAVAVEAILGFIEEVTRPLTVISPGGVHLRMSPNGNETKRASALLLPSDVALIKATMDERITRYGRPLTNSVSELPNSVIGRVAVPRLVRDILESEEEDHLTFDNLRQEGRFDLGSWTVSMA